MIVFTRFSLVELSVQGKNFNWKKPDICPSCKSPRLWGHGYRLARFVGFVVALWLKRYRCDSCKSVVTIRPEGYFKRYQSSSDDISVTLTKRLSNGKWSGSHPRQRSWQWLKRFNNFVRIEYGDDNSKVSLLERLTQLHTSSCQFLSELA